jgi:hypothetical protein
MTPLGFSVGFAAESRQFLKPLALVGNYLLERSGPVNLKLRMDHVGSLLLGW